MGDGFTETLAAAKALWKQGDHDGARGTAAENARNHR